ncbi:MAG: single-stranded DNA-binding protein [Candidatus Aminicenantes bacterium]
MSENRSASAENLREAALRLRRETGNLRFTSPVHTIYHPLEYAWEGHARYLSAYGPGEKKIIFLGMNPGPWGMAQTGVPFGEIHEVRDWLCIQAVIKKPAREHSAKRVEGFSCRRSEISGKRLWGFFRRKFKTPGGFFVHHFVANYCPLLFLEKSGRNLTPDKLKPDERRRLYSPCDRHLLTLKSILKPEWIIGIGRFAEKRCRRVFKEENIQVGGILHPSPANPRANRGWERIVEVQLRQMGVWDK